MSGIRANYHTHTFYCKHAEGAARDYALAAVRAGLCELGISDHAPFPDKDFGYRMDFCQLDQYCADIDAAAQEFCARVRILKALEVEYLEEYERDGYYDRLFLQYGMDYLVLGEHFFNAADGAQHNVTSLAAPRLAVDYARACERALKTGYFKILAHPDLFCINQFAWNDDYERASDIIIEAALLTGALLEHNANGYRRGLCQFPDGERYQYPCARFWQKVKGAGVTAITGSDAHNPDILWDSAVEKSIEALRELGIPRAERLLL
mgnify:CR=1 FL=1